MRPKFFCGLIPIAGRSISAPLGPHRSGFAIAFRYLVGIAFQDGPFTFGFRLYEDPGFGHDASMAWQYSDIPGVDHHVAWVYHGPEHKDITE